MLSDATDNARNPHYEVHLSAKKRSAGGLKPTSGGGLER